MQRPHHFVRWAHGHWNCEVCWVEPYPARLPRFSDWRRLRGSHASRQELGPDWAQSAWLRTLAPHSLPLEPLALGRAWLRHLHRQLRARLLDLLADGDGWLVIGRPSGLAVDLCAELRGRHVLYDVMDDMPHFSGGLSQRWMRRAHESLLAEAELVWGSSRKLVDAMHGRTRQPALLVRNGTGLPEITPAAEAAASQEKALVLGYVGTIASWFDWPALIALAQQLPEARIEVYGPLEAPPPTALPPSIRLHGPVPHDQVFALMRGWHAGLIPFVRNTLTASVDPVKYYEYRACGLPVLSTMFGEMPEHARHDPGLWDLEDATLTASLPRRLAQWGQERAQRLAEGHDPVPAYIRAASWDARFASGSQAMEDEKNFIAA